MAHSISLIKLKDNDDYIVDFEIVRAESGINASHTSDLDSDIENYKSQIAKLDNKIDRYTNYADNLDYKVAASCGLLCGLIDAFFVGEFSFEEGMKFTNAEMEEKIINLAKKHGWKGVTRGDRKGTFPLDAAIKYLEENFKMPSDPLEHVFGGTKQHHLRDFAHHHSIVGLFFSILTQFTGKAYGTDTNGCFVSYEVPEEMIGKDFKRKWAIAVTDWSLHLASDMHGSNSTAGFGTGIPGPMLSLLKLISALPIFGTKHHVPGEAANPNALSLFCAKLYNGTLLGQRDENGKLIPVKIDLRGERAIGHELKKQAIPVIINEVLVRTFYLIRRLYMEIKEKDIHSFADVDKLNWQKIVPVFNQTINRMMLVASGTFLAVDMADAAIRSAAKSGGSLEKFGLEMLLRINYPNIGRVAIGLGTERYMTFRRSKLRTERMAVMTELLMANNIKIFLHQKEMWVAGTLAEEAVGELYKTAEKSSVIVSELLKSRNEDMEEIVKYKEGIETCNPGLLERLNLR